MIVRSTAALAAAALLVASCSGSGRATPSMPASTPDAPSSSQSPSAPAATLAESPDPTQIAVLAGESWIVYEGPIEGGAGNRLIRPDGTADHWASPDVPVAPGGWQVHPDWSPDGLRLAFSADDGGEDRGLWTRDLWIAEAGQSGAVKVLDCVLPCQEYESPAWSPDGRTIAFTTFDVVDGISDGSRLMALDVSSGATRELSRTTGAEYIKEPRWSPDGRSLVVELERWSDTSTSSVQNGSAIAVVNQDADSSAPRRLTKWDLWATYPDWHPTEDLIVFSTRPWTTLDEGPSNLYSVRSDGTALTALTDFVRPSDRAVQPTWTPDGTAIIFTRVAGTGFGKPMMAMIDPDGSNLRSATGASWVFGTHPRLRPLP